MEKPVFYPKVMVMSMLILLLCACGVTLCGSGLFLLPSFDAPTWLNNPIPSFCFNSLMLWLNMSFMALYSCKLITKYSIKVMILFIPIIIIVNLMNFMPIVIVTVYVMALVASKYTNIRQLTIRFMFINLMTLVYQELALIVRAKLVSVVYVRFEVQSNAIMLLDLILFLAGLVLLEMKGGEHDGFCIRMVIQRAKGNHQVLEKADSEISSQETIDQEVTELTGWDKFGLVLLQLFQFILVSLAVAVNNRFIVFVFMFLFGFFPMNNTPGTKYHAKTFFGCCWQSIVFFYVLCASAPALNVSVFAPAIIGALGSFGMAAYAYKTSAITEVAELFEKATDTFNIKVTRTKLKAIVKKEDFIALLDKTTFDQNTKQILIFHYLDGKSFSFIGDTLNYSEATIKRKHREALKLLDTLLI